MSMDTQTREELNLALEVATVNAAAPAVDYGVVVMGREQFENLSCGVVRLRHAIDATKNPDSVSVLEYDGQRFFMASKSVSVTRGEFVLISFGQEEEQLRTIVGAYRHYCSDPQTVASDATAAFAELLEHHAIPYINGDRRVRFVPTLEVVQGSSMDAAAITEDVVRQLGLPIGPASKFSLCMSIKTQGPNMPVRLTWPFVIDRKSYLASIQ